MKPTENVLRVIRKMNSKSIARFAIYLLEQKLLSEKYFNYQFKNEIKTSFFQLNSSLQEISLTERLLQLFRYYLVENIATEKYLSSLKQLIFINDYYELREIFGLYNIDSKEYYYINNFNFSYNDFFNTENNSEKKQIELLNLFIEQYS